MCPEEGILQAYLDGELDLDMAVQVAGHLAGCAACREKLHDLEALAAGTTAALAPYRQETAAAVRPVRVPRLRHLPHRYQPLTETRRFADMVQRHRWFAGAAASVLALSLFLSWAPGRGLAAQFLSIFRMERIEVIEITPEAMAELGRLLEGHGGEVDIENFGRVEVIEPAQWSVEADPSQLEALSGLKLDLPSRLGGWERTVIVIEYPPTITFAPDVEHLNSYLRRLGGVPLPADLAGESFTLNIPPLVRVQYGQAQVGKGFFLYAARDLTIDAPPGVDGESLRQALLGLPFLPEDLRRQLAAIDDWRHTLPIPDIQGQGMEIHAGSWAITSSRPTPGIQGQGMGIREIMVNGNEGVYFPYAHDAANNITKVSLAWRQDGSWRAIVGLSLEEALRVAAEVR
ncbi:MAG TPA: zf-HC2 domain-containing protein [Bacillota bacterium]|nr:zf-HC2 domain-containing protein [Bacillota bacterium]